LHLVPPEHRVLEHTSTLDKALKVLQRLSPEELREIDHGHAKLALLRQGEKIVKPFDADAVAAAAVRSTTEGEIVRYLDADRRRAYPI